MTEQERLLTDEEREPYYQMSTVGYSYGGGAVREVVDIEGLLQAQDAKTYPIAFEAGKKEGMRDIAGKIKQALEEKKRLAAVEKVLDLEERGRK